jgi:hypothetical protein
VKSTWHAKPAEATYYCEVVFGREDEKTDWNSGYTASPEKPDLDTVWDLVPVGYTLHEYRIHRVCARSGAMI